MRGWLGEGLDDTLISDGNSNAALAIAAAAGAEMQCDSLALSPSGASVVIMLEK